MHDPIPKRDGDWQFDGDDWKRTGPSYEEALRVGDPWFRRFVPTWVVVLLLSIALLVIAIPPLATALVKGHV